MGEKRGTGGRRRQEIEEESEERETGWERGFTHIRLHRDEAEMGTDERHEGGRVEEWRAV